MEYKLVEFSIAKLVSLIDTNQIDLNPEYQRNYIWTPTDQKELIDTVLLGYPLPCLFIYSRPDGMLEMVDGQQRSKTIYRFVKGIITSSKKTGQIRISDSGSSNVLQYRLPVILIDKINAIDSIRDFYVLINKKGVHLNPAEVQKSEHFGKLFLKLADEVLTYQNLINLDIFSEKTSKRMNDRAFVEELLSLLKTGVSEKKKAVAEIYKSDIDDEEYLVLRDRFYKIIDKISQLNSFKELRTTRYKQKNDFYTLFSFINDNIDESDELRLYQYKILLVLDSKDRFGRQFIRPTNEDCEVLREYAINCVSQSNSSTAREKRLSFFNRILKNVEAEPTQAYIDVLNFLSEQFDEKEIGLIEVEKYRLLDISSFFRT